MSLQTVETPAAASAAAPSRQHRVFVYGTLREGFGNHRRLLAGRSDFQGGGTTKPEYTMLDLGPYPGVVSGGTSVIVGEVYSVDDSVLRDLDMLEGHPSFYKRTPIVLQDEREVVIYLLNSKWNAGADARKIVKSGDWKRRG